MSSGLGLGLCKWGLVTLSFPLLVPVLCQTACLVHSLGAQQTVAAIAMTDLSQGVLGEGGGGGQPPPLASMWRSEARNSGKKWPSSGEGKNSVNGHDRIFCAMPISRLAVGNLRGR